MRSSGSGRSRFVHGDYGVVCRAWLMFGAWVGARPGEYFGLDWDALDFEQGLVTITRIKGRKQTDQVVFPKRAQDAILEMPGPAHGPVVLDGPRLPDREGVEQLLLQPGPQRVPDGPDGGAAGGARGGEGRDGPVFAASSRREPDRRERRR
jgi:hypothetical protein